MKRRSINLWEMRFSYFLEIRILGVEQDAKSCVEMAICYASANEVVARTMEEKWDIQPYISVWVLVQVIAT